MKHNSLSVLDTKTKTFFKGAFEVKYLRPEDAQPRCMTNKIVMAAKFRNTEDVLERFEHVINAGFFNHGRFRGEKTITDDDLKLLIAFVERSKDFRVVHYSNISLVDRIDATIKNANYVKCNLYNELKHITNFQINQDKFSQHIGWFAHYMQTGDKRKKRKYILHIKPGRDVLLNQSSIDEIKETVGKDAIFSDNVPNINSTSAYKLFNNFYVGTDNITDLNLIKLSCNISDIESIETSKLDWFS